MTNNRRTYKPLYITLLFCILQIAGIAMYGQDNPRVANKRLQKQQTDSLGKSNIALIKPVTAKDSIAIADSIALENKKKMLELTGTPSIKATPIPTDSLRNQVAPKIWIPNPVKATWLALVIPGGGQIYNRKYWKLPIFYGGFAGCAYALTWNSKMYKDYSLAYKDAVNNHWESNSITDLLPPGYIDRVSKTQITETLRKQKDTFRRYRDMSIFAFIGVYLLSVVDAYIDAELSNFDISPDLSMRVEPAVINTQITGSSKKNVGVQCSFRF